MIKRKGFTLIELLVVIAIIGILATIVFISYGNATEKAKYTKVKSDLKTIDDAVTLAFASSSDPNSVPRTLNGTAVTWSDFHAPSGHLEGNCSLPGTAYEKENLVDTLGNPILQNYPTPPQILTSSSEDHADTINVFGGWCGTYKLYIDSYSNHATGIETPSTGSGSSDKWCVFKGGSVFSGDTEVSRKGFESATVKSKEEYCNPEQ